MDFQSLKRRELQALCKKNNLPANLTNSAMADSLSSLPFVEGLEEFMRQPEVEGAESGEISVITSPSAPRTTSRRQATKEVLEEGSKMATRTRCGTRRRGVEGTDTRKTPATRTIRSKGFHEDSIQKKAGKDMQADFEADLESEVSETTVLSDVGKKEISEEVSTVSVEQEGQSLESQNEAPNAVLAVANDGKEAIEVDDVDENLEVDDGEVHEEVEEIAKLTNASQKLDFHSLGRKDLQSLCKKNKIPANTTNVTMASALESLEIVIGLEEFIKGYDPETALSPEMSDMRSVRRSCTGRKASKEPMSSKLMTKSSRGTRTRVMEEIEQAKKVAFETPATQSTRHKAGQTGLALSREEAAQKKEMQTQSRRGASRNVAQEMENSSMEEAEGMSDTNADVGMLLVAEAEEEVQCQLEALNIEKAADLDCVSESNNIGDDGIDGLLKIENLKQQQEPVVEDDSNLVVDVNAEGSEVTEQAGYMVNETGDSEVSEQLGGLVDERDDNVNRSADISSIVEDVNAEGSEVTAPPGDIVNENEEDSEIPKELGDLVDERDNNHTSADISEIPEQPRNLVNRTDEIVEGITNAELQEVPEQIVNTDSENVDEDTDASLEATEECDSGSFHLTTEDSTVDLSPTEKHKGSHEEDQLLEEFDSRSITQDDELLTLNGDVKGEFEISLVEEQNTADRDAHVCSVEDEDDKQKFVTDLTIAEVEPLLAVGDNLERESEKTQHENVTIPAADSIPIGKLEAFAEEKMSVKFAESTISAVQCTQKEKGTPLCNKSLRKLKKMVKEKLQETTLLAKEMEKLTLEESKTTLTKAEEDLQEENVELDVESNEVAPMGKSEADDAPVFTMIIQDAGEESDDQTIGFKSDNDGDLSNALENTNTKSDANVSALFPVNILLDHELVSEDSVSGQIVVDSSMTPSKPWKPLLLTTPSKSSSRTPLHSDINKENVDHSASKTEPGKIKMVVAGSGKLLSTMSMGKLKKEFKDLQQSEKRRQALQARSENCCSLSSP